MKAVLPALIILCFLFFSCNQHPTRESHETVSGMDSGSVEALNIVPDSIMIREPIINSLKRHFSDTLNMDSFAAEMPAGNILKNDIVIRIYSHDKALLFTDSVSASDYLEDAVYNQPNPQPDVAVNDLRRGVMHLFNPSYFTSAGKADDIKNASGAQIKNMVGWNEAVDDSAKPVFVFSDSFRGTRFVAYSQKLKKAVVIVGLEPEAEGE
jgi:hypothetical protein